MDINIAQLASDITQHLLTSATLMSIIKEAGKGASSEMGKKLLLAATGKTREILEQLWPKIESSPTAIEAAKDMALIPDDLDNQASFRKELKRLLGEDDFFTRSIAHLFEEAKSIGEVKIIFSGNRNVNVSGSVYGDVVTGDNKTKES